MGNDTDRLEAFSDGVIAVAITLLVFDLHAPDLGDHVSGGELWRALRAQWPSYDAFIISFAVIGIMWVNHHNLFRIIVRTNHYLILINLALLFCIAVIPFPTAVLSRYLGQHGEGVATVVYTGWFFITSIVFNAFWRYAAGIRRLLSPHADMRAVASATRRYNLGLIGYAAAFLLEFMSPPVSLALMFLLGLVFVLPSSTGGQAMLHRPANAADDKQTVSKP